MFKRTVPSLTVRLDVVARPNTFCPEPLSSNTPAPNLVSANAPPMTPFPPIVSESPPGTAMTLAPARTMLPAQVLLRPEPEPAGSYSRRAPVGAPSNPTLLSELMVSPVTVSPPAISNAAFAATVVVPPATM